MLSMSYLQSWTPVAKEYHPLSCGSIDGTDDYPHDKGILRALNSVYTPNKQVVGDPLCTIFVGRLNPDTNEDTLQKIFEDFGKIKRLRLVRDILSGISKRYAFIEYKSGTSAHRAATQADKMMVDDREILVDMECERELKGWIPRRLGGGFGGKKESGQLRFGGKDRPFRKPIILKLTGERFHQESHNGKQKSSTDQTLRVRASDDSSCDSKSAHVKFSNKYDRSDKSRSRYTDYEAYKGESSSGRDRSDRSHRKRMHESSRHKDYTRRRSTSREKRKSKKLHRRSRSSSREPKRKK